MPHRISVFSPSLHALIAATTLTMCLAARTQGAMGAEAMAESAGGQGASQNAVPSRARDYIDDYAQLNALREGVISLPSGVQYEILQTGDGKQPRASDTVRVHYRGMLANGVEFDNTYERGEPATLHLDQYLVPGLKEALLLMKEGDEWRVTIPAKMGFRGGRLLRKRDLIYEIALIAIEQRPDDAKPAATPSVPGQ